MVAATPSSDTTAPSSTISSPSAGANLQDGAKTTITGSATDSGGGVVAGVEVSTDAGNTWHPATLTTPDGTTVSWSYTWVAHGSPTTTIESRAIDDSGNIETPSAGVAGERELSVLDLGNDTHATRSTRGTGAPSRSG